MGPSATSLWGLKLLVYEPLSYYKREREREREGERERERETERERARGEHSK
jgi:hypothetical protein